MTHRVLIVGAGRHGRAVAEALHEMFEYAIVGFLDDTERTAVWNWRILGTTSVALDAYRSLADHVIVAIGDNKTRQELQLRFLSAGFFMITVIHPRALVSKTARVGDGCAVMQGAIVGTEAVVEDGAIVNAGAVVDHHCRVEAYGHVGTNASMAGGSVLGQGAWMQAGAALGYRVRVAPGEVLGPGEARSRG